MDGGLEHQAGPSFAERSRARHLTVAPPESSSPARQPDRSQTVRRDNFPAEVSSFVGRDSEIEEITRLLDTHRLVTLSGAPGVGKSRLATRVAARLLPRFDDGAWLIELAGLAEGSLVPQAVASVLHVRAHDQLPLVEMLTDALRGQRLLLLLDNCEHVLAACTDLVSQLLTTCPHLVILATSRQPLKVIGEVDWQVPPLPAPTANGPTDPTDLVRFDAVRLFVDRARTTRPRFSLTHQNSAAVAHICADLDGLPLAIELAAAWLKVLAPAQVAERLGNRLSLLAGAERIVAPRHRDLRTVLDSSFSLLSEAEQILFRRMAVFAGGWTLEAAEHVGAPDEDRGSEPPAQTGESGNQPSVLHLLAGLVEKSLVVMEERNGSARYRLLETLREYGLERLRESGEESIIRARHLQWLLALVEAGSPTVSGEFRHAWRLQVAAEMDNLRLALAWGRDSATREPVHGRPLANQDHSPLLGALRLAAAAYFLWYWHGQVAEGHAWIEQLLQIDQATGGPSSPDRLRTRMHAGIILGSLTALTGESTSARRLLIDGAAMAAATGDQLAHIQASIMLGNVSLRCRQLDQATAHIHEALALAQVHGYAHFVGISQFYLAQIAIAGGDFDCAKSLLEELLAVAREADVPWGMSEALSSLARIASERGDHTTAARHFQEALAAQIAWDDRIGQVYVLESLAWELAMLGVAERAATLLGAAVESQARFGLARLVSHPAHERRDAVRDAVQSMLGAAAFDEAFNRGRRLSRAEAIDLALQHDTVSDEGVSAEPAPAENVLKQLTRREQEIMALVGRGYTNRQIADAAVISERTAEWYVAKLRARFGFETRSQLAVWAAKHLPNSV